VFELDLDIPLATMLIQNFQYLNGKTVILSASSSVSNRLTLASFFPPSQPSVDSFEVLDAECANIVQGTAFRNMREAGVPY
jgi:hypothetical protein